MAGCGKNREQERVRNDGAAEPFPSCPQPGTPGIARLAEGAANQRDSLLVGGLAGQVADNLAPKAGARDRKRRRKPQIRIVLLLREAMMQDVILAVRVQIDEQQIVGEPGAFEVVEADVVGEQAVRRIVRENRKPEL